MNRYYLAGLGTNQGTRNQRVNTLRTSFPDGPSRQSAFERLHYAVSLNGRYYLAQAEASDAEHASIITNNWITAFAGRDEAMAYMEANPDLWQGEP